MNEFKEVVLKLLELEKRIEKLERKKKSEQTGTAELRQTFLEAYREKFGHDYIGWGAKENSMAKNWLKSVPLETALMLTRAYVQWKEAFVTRSGHPFALLVTKYVQLDADMKRFPEIMKTIAVTKTREKLLMESIGKEMEVKAYADQKRHDSQISAPVREGISDETLK